MLVGDRFYWCLSIRQTVIYYLRCRILFDVLNVVELVGFLDGFLVKMLGDVGFNSLLLLWIYGFLQGQPLVFRRQLLRVVVWVSNSWHLNHADMYSHFKVIQWQLKLHDMSALGYSEAVCRKSQTMSWVKLFYM